ncbi:MAG: hypothetical protein A2W52_01930 [Candidatus Taylorbacteria bacterium RIFCSPHIGHO2_02_49_25]|uniref:Methionine--tRNA ligase n=1 Tax=Candidatus Taylorbacteria bacterium RIFCSPHIGHO2_02_49_25 TaxID=1802305 RepID=A0A1G2MCP0_9BACT|nr:MAG: hypothetical protein A2759_03570 [Candidatus Taylorbacteria bacterium RIFCSPHIGHO2_01_FULL_49_60]OHA21583.1 MAG: hypothetical protein A2W52_01930 [Candidatus Taylorbacteria bacterium RIFCSPHIGHO2_02_49_25]OHA36659.1 MAG: hypothetical protein A3B27_00665 [Candidatus Taylorbacteria bacterium RIFCSPLOWO2_01_FULL_50_130]OHA42240.1 MAG: hypothetical protein A3H73_02475 [Candidatus Taylorbacteria bacterium RIFCSPLOWO2_02_FULL_50_120]OHA46938.1 MAG: hypothetical protein A3G61_04590 [Candidatus
MNPKSSISFDDFQKVELTVGRILSAEKVPETEKLLKLSVNVGESAPRQIISGIVLYFPDPQALVGRKFMFVTNIPVRTIKGLESSGMILAVSTEDGKSSLLEPNADVPEGARA